MVIYAPEQVELVRKRFVVIPKLADGLPPGPHTLIESREAYATWTFGIAWYCGITLFQRQYGVQRLQSTIRYNRFTEVDIVHVPGFDGLTGYGGKVQVSPGFLVLRTSAGIYGNGLTSLNYRCVFGFGHEEQTARDDSCTLSGVLGVNPNPPKR